MGIQAALKEQMALEKNYQFTPVFIRDRNRQTLDLGRDLPSLLSPKSRMAFGQSYMDVRISTVLL